MLNKIVAYRVNSGLIKCGADSRPIKNTKRATARKMEHGEKIVEKLFLSNEAIKSFTPKKCAAYGFLVSSLPRKCINWINVRGFAELMSDALSIEFPREAYRRFATTMFWIETNLEAIKDYISKNNVEIILYNGNEFKMEPSEDSEVYPLLDKNDICNEEYNEMIELQPNVEDLTNPFFGYLE